MLQALPEGGAGWTTHQALLARGQGGLKPASGKHIEVRRRCRGLGHRTGWTGMEDKAIVREGFNAIAASYLATRSEDSEDVRLLQELVERLPKGAQVLDAGCGAGVPVTRYLSGYFDVTGCG